MNVRFFVLGKNNRKAAKLLKEVSKVSDMFNGTEVFKYNMKNHIGAMINSDMSPESLRIIEQYIKKETGSILMFTA